jgi:hypothetical protein
MKGSLEYSSNSSALALVPISAGRRLSRPVATLVCFLPSPSFQQEFLLPFLGCSRCLIGTVPRADRYRCMSEPIQTLIQSSLQIAWDFLMRTGEIQDPNEASRFLLKTINDLILKGERRKLVLADRAIVGYQRLKALRKAEAAA